MGKFLKVLYYNFYLFYKWLPGGSLSLHFNSYSAIGVCFGFVLNFVFNLITILCFQYIPPWFVTMGILFIGVIFSHKYYSLDMVNSILSVKPSIINPYVSILTTILFFLSSLLLFAILPMLGEKFFI